ncbi:MAG TPA: FGGY family carbohydrate kinase [Propionibacteriaceae bacterium]|nr:FGGY family carbohydrate kinase [Propionibacteriaceae bacterium]
MTTLLAVDQGTQSTKALLVGRDHAVAGRAAVALDRDFPRPGWVEQDAEAIWASVVEAADGVPAARVDGIALSTQRETVLAWDALTGEPLGPALSWQDQRAVDICERLADLADVVSRTTGLLLDPMFSAAKIAWLLDTYDPDRAGCASGRVKVGTIDAWLLWRLTGRHLTEAGNASRTSLLDIAAVAWDERLCDAFGVPVECLPEVVSSMPMVPTIRAIGPAKAGTPVAAVLGDSHAALFANGGWRPGSVKASYGTGSSIMAVSEATTAPGLCRTIAWDGPDGVTRALEGNIRSSGATLTWLCTLLGVSAAELSALAVGGSPAVHLVPAFGGLGAPYWDARAVGLVDGLDMGTSRADLARAALESVAYQVSDVLDAVAAAGRPATTVLADGGATASDLLMQWQADLAQACVVVSDEPELSALGAADLAGVAVGGWAVSDLEAMDRPRHEFTPAVSAADAASAREGWTLAVSRARLTRKDRP